MKVSVVTLVGIGGTMALRHAVHGKYDYMGCVNINDLSCLTAVPVHPAGVLNPETCQAACAAYEYAAVFWDSCRCGNELSSLTHLDDTKCDHPCRNSWFNGACGHYSVKDGHYFANLYTKCGDGTPVTVGPVSNATVIPLSVTMPGPVISISTVTITEGCNQIPASADVSALSATVTLTNALTVSAPSLTIPSVQVPSVQVPSVQIPSVTIISEVIPMTLTTSILKHLTVTAPTEVPSLSIPSLPTLSVPSLSVPSLSVPTIPTPFVPTPAASTTITASVVVVTESPANSGATETFSEIEITVTETATNGNFGSAVPTYSVDVTSSLVHVWPSVSSQLSSIASSLSSELLPATTTYTRPSNPAASSENHGASPGHDSNLGEGAAPQVAISGASYAMGVAMAMLAMAA